MKHKLLLLAFMMGLVISANGQNIRAAYSFYYKTDVSQEKYRTQSDMMLDWSIGCSVYYNDASFHRDSLSNIAFDKNGNISNSEAYQKIFDYRSGAINDVTFIDFSEKKFETVYRPATIFPEGKGILELPRWQITDETTVTSMGFAVRKATAEYLGRKWVIWYCEDIPVSAGPWLLWGAPGLIAHAYDSEEIFHFKLLNVQELGTDSRYAQIKDFCESPQGVSVHRYTYEMSKAEQVHNKMMRDLDYMFSMAGESPSQVTVVDKNGRSSVMSNTRNYIPLIPDGYWK